MPKIRTSVEGNPKELPFQITFRDFKESDAVWISVQNRIEKLQHFFEGIIRCEVTLSCPHRHRHADRLFNIKIHIAIPGDDIIVNRNPSQDESHTDIYVAIRDSFDAAERILQDKVRKFRNMTKVHSSPYSEGKISRIFFNEGYGFVLATDGRECYFGEKSLLNTDFGHLEVGQKVRFVEESGEKGPQVTSMALL